MDSSPTDNLERRENSQESTGASPLNVNQINFLKKPEHYNRAISILQKHSQLRTDDDLYFLNSCLLAISYFSEFEQNLEKETKKEVLKELRYQHFKKGEIVFHAGDIGKHFFMVLKGSVYVLTRSRSENRKSSPVISQKYPKYLNSPTRNVRPGQKTDEISPVKTESGENFGTHPNVLETHPDFDNAETLAQLDQVNDLQMQKGDEFDAIDEGDQADTQRSNDDNDATQKLLTPLPNAQNTNMASLSQGNDLDLTQSPIKSNNEIFLNLKRNSQSPKEKIVAAGTVERIPSQISPVTSPRKVGSETQDEDLPYISEAQLKSQYPRYALVATLHGPDYFGEVALEQSCPRTATIMCREDCDMAVLRAAAYHRILSEYHDKKDKLLIDFFKANSITASLPQEKLKSLIRQVNHVTYKRNQFIYLEGDKANDVYFIKEGEIELTKGVPMELNLEENLYISASNLQDKISKKTFYGGVNRTWGKFFDQKQTLKIAILGPGCSLGELEIGLEEKSRKREYSARVSSQTVSLMQIDYQTLLSHAENKQKAVDSIAASSSSTRNWLSKMEESISKTKNDINIKYHQLLSKIQKVESEGKNIDQEAYEKHFEKVKKTRMIPIKEGFKARNILELRDQLLDAQKSQLDPNSQRLPDSMEPLNLERFVEYIRNTYMAHHSPVRMKQPKQGSSHSLPRNPSREQLQSALPSNREKSVGRKTSEKKNESEENRIIANSEFALFKKARSGNNFRLDVNHLISYPKVKLTHLQGQNQSMSKQADVRSKSVNKEGVGLDATPTQIQSQNASVQFVSRETQGVLESEINLLGENKPVLFPTGAIPRNKSVRTRGKRRENEVPGETPMNNKTVMPGLETKSHFSSLIQRQENSAQMNQQPRSRGINSFEKLLITALPGGNIGRLIRQPNLMESEGKTNSFRSFLNQTQFSSQNFGNLQGLTERTNSTLPKNNPPKSKIAKNASADCIELPNLYSRNTSFLQQESSGVGILNGELQSARGRGIESGHTSSVMSMPIISPILIQNRTFTNGLAKKQVKIRASSFK